MNSNRTRRLRWAIYITLLVQVIAVLYTLFQMPEPGLGMLGRGAALFGYTALFWSILSSEYMREMRKVFGRPFLKIHHSLAVIAWGLILTHPVSFALLSKDATVLVPVFSPFRTFLQLAGRPALYLVGVATVAGLLRRSIKKNWKVVHWLNYMAFLLVFIHAWLIGTDLASGLLRFIWATMAAIVLIVFARKRLGRQ